MDTQSPGKSGGSCDDTPTDAFPQWRTRWRTIGSGASPGSTSETPIAKNRPNRPERVNPLRTDSTTRRSPLACRDAHHVNERDEHPADAEQSWSATTRYVLMRLADGLSSCLPLMVAALVLHR
jgi:hypothetical protein